MHQLIVMIVFFGRPTSSPTEPPAKRPTPTTTTSLFTLPTDTNSTTELPTAFSTDLSTAILTYFPDTTIHTLYTLQIPVTVIHK